MAIIPAKTIREHIARGQKHVRRKETPDAVTKAAEAVVYITLANNLMPKDRSECETHLRDLLKAIEMLPEIRRITNKPLNFVRGKEALLHQQLQAIKQVMDASAANAVQADEAGRAKQRDEYLEKAKAHIRAEEFPQARRALNQACELFPQDMDLLVTAGSIMLDGKQGLDAQKMLEKALESKPRESGTWKLLVEAYKLAGDFEGALGALTRMKQTFGGHPRIFTAIARTYLEMRRFNDATEHAELALSLDPDHQEAREVLELAEKRQVA